jgi:transposase InsO family protein
MPVRAVPPNAVSLTGQLATTKSVGPAAFESSLERDWLAQLDRDPAVACFEVQPLVVPYHDAAGRPHTYTPDVLVSYADGRPLGLYEVKYRAALKPTDPTERHLMACKFWAARAFARARGWRFQLVSEREIRGAMATAPATPPPVTAPDLEAIAPAVWAEALRRFETIRPLLGPGGASRAAVAARARETGVGPATIYRWLAQYGTGGTVSALVPQRRGPAPGASRLPAAVEAVLDRVLRAEHLRAERPRVSDTLTAVQHACRAAGLRRPSERTVRRRLRQLAATEREAVIAAREGRAAARRVRPAVGQFPHAPAAHAVVQMDHTQLDLIVVDAEHRQPIGRPWLTLAIDVASRMVSGLYVSLDPPGTLSAGLCLAHALLPKAPWLATLELPDTLPPALVVWPSHGLVRTVHLDKIGRAHV